MAFLDNILGDDGNIDLSIFADVAFSGDFNDLINIPSIFNPGLQEVTDISPITTNSITVGGLTSGNLFSDGYNFGISDSFDTNYNLLYQPYVGLTLDDFNGNQSILNPFGLQLNSGILSYIGPSVAWSLPASSGTIALLSDITIGTTSTLQEVTTEGNVTNIPLEVNDGSGLNTLIEAGGIGFDNGTKSKSDNLDGIYFQESVFTMAVERPTTLTQSSYIKYKETPNPVTEETLAFVSDIPTTATDLDALKRDGSNANADIDIDTYSFKAKSVFIGGANKMESRGDNLTAPHTAQWLDQDYIGIEDTSNKGIPNGYAPLNSSSQVPSANLPAYVDDIVEGYLLAGVFYEEVTHTTAITGEVGKIYIDLTIGQSSKQYRWSGSVYNQITNGFIASTADVPDSADKRYQTDAQQSYNDATSPIQAQLDSKQDKTSWISQLDPYTGTGSTALQKLSNAGSSGNGSFPALANTRYRVEVEFAISGLSGTTNSIQFGFLGSAVITKIFGESFASKSATLISSNTPTHTAINVATISASLMTAGTQAYARAKLDFTVITGAGGSLIPSFATNVSTTPVIEYLHINFIPLDSNTTTSSSDIV